MRGAEAGIRKDLETRLAELERHNTEWRSWLRLLRELAGALNDPAWATPIVGLPARAEPGGDGAPLLHGRELCVDANQLRRLVRRLAKTAAAADAAPESGTASLKRYRPSAADAVALLQAVMREDQAAITALAAAAGVDGAALGTVARLVAFPILLASARQLEPELPLHWSHGYCPVCGAWALLAELRGLDRARRLRCGRCSGDWQISWLCCPFCGEADHARLGSLVPEQELETRKVETCASCHGYLKSVTTLQPTPPLELLVRDLETLELDLVAVDRGYVRPDGPGYRLDIRVTARPSRSILPFVRDG